MKRLWECPLQLTADDNLDDQATKTMECDRAETKMAVSDPTNVVDSIVYESASLCWSPDREESVAKRKMLDFSTPEKSLSLTPFRSLKRVLFQDVDTGDEKSMFQFQTPPKNKRNNVTPKSVKRSLYSSMASQESQSKKIKTALTRLTGTDDLIGDGSTQHCLPTIKGHHNDLHYVTSDTVVSVIKGACSDVISGFRILDCRYPYEYKGGHIKGATNVRSRDDLKKVLEEKEDNEGKGKRSILFLYCEFSSERGPKLCRMLRGLDRELNKENYPELIYPEIYIVSGGYKSFYHSHKSLCEPKEYVPMLHPDHVLELRHFRSKSKSCSVTDKRGRRGNSLRF
ncbi:hypothetical protein ScPMuIL_015518 [Solemya velum]